VGRIACYAIEAGESPVEIRNALRKCVTEAGGDCDCEGLKNLLAGVEIALGLAITVMLAVLTRGRALSKANRQGDTTAIRDALRDFDRLMRQDVTRAVDLLRSEAGDVQAANAALQRPIVVRP